MDNFFKSKKKPKVNQVELLGHGITEKYTHLSEWGFKLPRELTVEMKEKYYIPKYKGVVLRDKDEIAFLDFSSIHFEYSLLSCGDDFGFDVYVGDDYREAKKGDYEENVYLLWRYYCSYDDGFFDVWDEPYDKIEIIGDDKEKLLNVLYPIMEKIIDGDPETKKRLYFFNG